MDTLDVKTRGAKITVPGHKTKIFRAPKSQDDSVVAVLRNKVQSRLLEYNATEHQAVDPARQPFDDLASQASSELHRVSSRHSGISIPIIHGLQPKLKIGAPNDKYEREADKVADQVMHMPVPQEINRESFTRLGNGAEIQRICDECEEELRRKPMQEDEGIQSKPLFNPTSISVQLHVNEIRRLRSKQKSGSAAQAPNHVQLHIDILRSSGRPLPESTRAYFEPRFGFDFGDVRVHTGERAAKAAQSINARAFTVGEHVVFGSGEYAPDTDSGKRLLAHELTHTIQQGGTRILQSRENIEDQSPGPTNRISEDYIARQCNPAWAALSWSQRVTNARGMAAGAARNQCMTDLISEALGPSKTVHQSTNNRPNINAAINANAYTELGSFEHVNFDQNLNAKTGNANQFGQAVFRTTAGGANLRLFIILGPRAVNPIGPQFTRMAYEHEDAHATDFLIQWATGAGPHAATAGEELYIYSQDFSNYFLDLWTINNTPPCAFQLANDFPQLFPNYAAAGVNDRNRAFTEIQAFYQVRIQRIPCNLMKFKIWLQAMQNARPAGDLLVNRINGLPGLGLVKGTAPLTHLQCPTPCP